MNHGKAHAKHAILALALALAVGCGTKDQTGGTPEPVEECLRFESALNTCFHRDFAVASQEAYLPKSKADRARLQSLCADNLKRLTQTCR